MNSNQLIVGLVVIVLAGLSIISAYGYIGDGNINEPSNDETDNETDNETESRDNRSDKIIDSKDTDGNKVESNNISNKKFTYDESANLSDGSVFKVKNVRYKYQITRTDNVPNPSYSLFVKEYKVKNNKLVIIEDFVDTSPDNMVAPSVISKSGYEETFYLNQSVDQVIIYHPFGDNPYVKKDI